MRFLLAVTLFLVFVGDALAQQTGGSSNPAPIQQVLVQMLGQAQLALAQAAAQNEQVNERLQEQQAQISQLEAENKALSGGRGCHAGGGSGGRP